MPVQVKGRYTQPICETAIDGRDWADKHWRALRSNYARARHFDETAAWLAPLYEAAAEDAMLSVMNRRFLEAVCARLGLATPITDSRDYAASGDPSEYLCRLTMAAGGDCYVSGPAARAYLRADVFAENGVDFAGSTMRALPNIHNSGAGSSTGSAFSTCMFNCGPDAPDYLRNARAVSISPRRRDDRQPHHHLPDRR